MFYRYLVLAALRQRAEVYLEARLLHSTNVHQQNINKHLRHLYFSLLGDNLRLLGLWSLQRPSEQLNPSINCPRQIPMQAVLNVYSSAVATGLLRVSQPLYSGVSTCFSV